MVTATNGDLLRGILEELRSQGNDTPITAKLGAVQAVCRLVDLNATVSFDCAAGPETATDTIRDYLYLVDAAYAADTDKDNLASLRFGMSSVTLSIVGFLAALKTLEPRA